MDGLHRLFHLIGGTPFLGVLGDRHRYAVQQAFVAVGIKLQPLGWSDKHRTASHATFGWSDFLKPGHKQPPDLRFVCHPLTQGGRHSTGVLTLHDPLCLVGIRRFNRPESSVHTRWRAIKDRVTAHQHLATTNR